MHSSQIRWFRILCLVPTLALGDSQTQSLGVTDLSPPPNYSYTASNSLDQELVQLTDGATSRMNIWTRKTSAGWVKRSPIRLELESHGKFSGKPAILRFHTVAQDGEVVAAIRRIDVFCRMQDGESFTLIGSKTFELESLKKSRESIWQEVPMAQACLGMVAVVHAAGTVLAIDEVELREDIQSSMTAARVSAEPVADPVKESDRLFRSEAIARQLRPKPLCCRRSGGTARRYSFFRSNPMAP